MVAMRRLWWMVLLGVLAVGGLACSSGKSASKAKSPAGSGAASPGPGGTSADLGPRGTDGGQTANGSVPGHGQQAAPGDTGPCKECQSAGDAVKRSDADGFSFETGEAEAGRISAGEPSGGQEKPATFDAGEGHTGVTGSSSLHPK